MMMVTMMAMVMVMMIMNLVYEFHWGKEEKLPPFSSPFLHRTANLLKR